MKALGQAAEAGPFSAAYVTIWLLESDLLNNIEICFKIKTVLKQFQTILLKNQNVTYPIWGRIVLIKDRKLGKATATVRSFVQN